MISAIRSLLLDLINSSDYFRIVKAITESLCEDLVYLSEHILDTMQFQGNMQIQSLARAGLMIEAGIDGNADVENQNYVFTTLGRMVDQYAISVDDENKYKGYMKKSSVLYDNGIGAISNEKIEKMFEL